MRPNAAAPSLLTLHALWMAALLTAMVALTGCAMGPRLIPSPSQGAAIRGSLHGGHQPVAGVTPTAALVLANKIAALS
jgi:hypothetical protein